MAGLHELELAAAPTTILESEGIERERGGRGDSILGLPDGAAAEKGEGRGRTWVAARELVGSSAQARIGKSSAWRR